MLSCSKENEPFLKDAQTSKLTNSNSAYINSTYELNEQEIVEFIDLVNDITQNGHQSSIFLSADEALAKIRSAINYTFSSVVHGFSADTTYANESIFGFSFEYNQNQQVSMNQIAVIAKGLANEIRNVTGVYHKLIVAGIVNGQEGEFILKLTIGEIDTQADLTTMPNDPQINSGPHNWSTGEGSGKCHTNDIGLIRILETIGHRYMHAVQSHRNYGLAQAAPTGYIVYYDQPQFTTDSIEPWDVQNIADPEYSNVAWVAAGCYPNWATPNESAIFWFNPQDGRGCFQNFNHLNPYHGWKICVKNPYINYLIMKIDDVYDQHPQINSTDAYFGIKVTQKNQKLLGTTECYHLYNFSTAKMKIRVANPSSYL
jgi:hypothetical protein